MDITFEEINFNIWLEWDNLYTSEQLEELTDWYVNMEKNEYRD